MCDVCGCGDPHVVSLPVHERILSANEHQARHDREHFREHGVLCINVMGSPGSGKTALLEATARLAPALSLAALSGDLATEHDAARLSRAGIRARAITGIDREIGLDFSVALTWRPLASQNIVVRFSAAALIPGEGFKDLYGSETPYSVLGNVVFTY